MSDRLREIRDLLCGVPDNKKDIFINGRSCGWAAKDFEARGGDRVLTIYTPVGTYSFGKFKDEEKYTVELRCGKTHEDDFWNVQLGLHYYAETKNDNTKNGLIDELVCMNPLEELGPYESVEKAWKAMEASMNEHMGGITPCEPYTMTESDFHEPWAETLQRVLDMDPTILN